MEMARFDSSIATFFGVHDGLAMGSIYLGGRRNKNRNGSADGPLGENWLLRPD